MKQFSHYLSIIITCVSSFDRPASVDVRSPGNTFLTNAYVKAEVQIRSTQWSKYYYKRSIYCIPARTKITTFFLLLLSFYQKHFCCEIILPLYFHSCFVYSKPYCWNVSNILRKCLIIVHRILVYIIYFLREINAFCLN